MSCIICITGAYVVRNNSLSGSPNAPIFLQGLGCRSDEHDKILDCEGAVHGITQCSHEQDAIVHCEGIITVFLPSSTVHFVTH